MTNSISRWQGAAMISTMKLTKSTRVMPSPPSVGQDGHQLISRALTRHPVMSADVSAMIVRMRWKNLCKPTMNHCRIWRTEGIVRVTVGIVLECAMIGQNSTKLVNKLMMKQMQRQAMYLKQRLYCNNWQDPRPKQIWESAESDK